MEVGTGISQRCAADMIVQLRLGNLLSFPGYEETSREQPKLPLIGWYVGGCMATS